MVQERERCDNCGNSYETVYSVDNAVWDKLAGLNVCLCPSCADEMARTKGLHPYWEMADGEYPTAKLKAENARLREALRECVKAIGGLQEMLAVIEETKEQWQDRERVGSRIMMFRVEHALENPKSSIVSTKASIIAKQAREVLADASA